MYTIKQAAARTGVSVDVLRAWERRYGVVAPKRTAAGYRLYDDEAVARIARMRRLVESGWSPATAAAALMDPALAPPDEPTAAPSDPEADGGRTHEGTQVGAFVAAAAAVDQPRIASVLDDMFAGRSLERALADEVYPSLRALGAAWSRGDVSVAGEHLASHAVLRRLAAAFEAAGGNRSDGRWIVIGLPPGSRHELGVLGFATVARRNGVRVVYLGADLPVDDWITGTEGAAAAVIGVPTPGDRASAAAVADRLRVERPSLRVALGGAGAHATNGELGLPSVILLPDDPPDAVAVLRSEVGLWR